MQENTEISDCILIVFIFLVIAFAFQKVCVNTSKGSGLKV